MDNDEEGVARASNAIQEEIIAITEIVRQMGITIIFSAGDNILGKTKYDVDIQKINLARERDGAYTFSVGIGETLYDAYLALKYAKSSGKNKTIIKNKKGFQIYKS